MKEVIDKHYKELAQCYDKFLYYSPQFVRTLSSKMVEKLDLKENDIFVDLGGGTGMYSIDIHQQVSLTNPSYCVDAYREMLEQIPRQHVNIKPVCMDALSFSSNGLIFNKVLIKEAVHHIKERERLFSNLYQRLWRGGRLLLVHVPPNIQYPIFQAALERAQNWHACPDELTTQLKNTGYEVERDSLDYRHKIPKEKYFEQVKTRFMSVLHTFSDEEMETGIAEMAEKYKDRNYLEFIDHFDYITAIKK